MSDEGGGRLRARLAAAEQRADTLAAERDAATEKLAALREHTLDGNPALRQLHDTAVQYLDVVAAYSEVTGGAPLSTTIGWLIRSGCLAPASPTPGEIADNFRRIAASGAARERAAMSVVTWDELLEHCSRLHTTRTRPMGPRDGAELREDSQTLDVTVDGIAATVVPTRMHEPGFYVRGRTVVVGPRREGTAWAPHWWMFRSDEDLAMFRRFVDNGLVHNPGVPLGYVPDGSQT